jgi:formamidopyrimidine-DNA glycosylase
MPELPEVETIKRGLSAIIIGQTIDTVEVFNPKSFQDFKLNTSLILGSKVINIDRTGKLLIISLSTGFSLVFHLKMTGQVVFRPTHSKEEGFGGGHPTKSLTSRLPDKSTRVIFKLGSGYLFFNDQRKFGWIKIVETGYHKRLINKMGPDVLDINTDQFISLIKLRHKSKVKPTLLDQSFVAGIGNIYADESLNVAHIHPSSKIGDILDDQLVNLYNSIQMILLDSIKLGGSSSRNYVDSNGNAGSYLDRARVYGRAGGACRDCGSEIIKLKVAGRGTYICGDCQKGHA